MEHGYVVVHGMLDAQDRDAIAAGWRVVVAEAAARVGLSSTEFVASFPQNRDLWRKQEHFEKLLFTSCQGEVARHFLSVSGVRLFHDHAICKPVSGSGRIPWHQDSAYWPLDRVGLSLWTPIDDVDDDGGCLEVLDGSHREGAKEPQDFLVAGSPIDDRDPRIVRLPVRAGDTVVLNGLTWHRSGPNRGARDRLAYLTLWVPATARFVPEHAGWHPTAAHIAVPAGARLDGEWFPLFGTVAKDDEGELVQFPQPTRAAGPSMFTASRDIAEHLRWLLGATEPTLAALLASCSAEHIALRAQERGLIQGEEVAALRDLVDALALQDRVRRESVARDVYLRTAERWWSLIGAKIERAQREP
jgi:ectoine hydroxylase-related dioxygenase (phytanoyl-CoA dioxygenase family)